MRFEMKALVSIGSDAVPELLKELEQVGKSVPPASPPGLTDTEWRLMLHSNQQGLIARLAMVLGEIGDERALPLLASDS